MPDDMKTLQKLEALAARGIGGEKENARRKADAMRERMKLPKQGQKPRAQYDYVATAEAVREAAAKWQTQFEERMKAARDAAHAQSFRRDYDPWANRTSGGPSYFDPTQGPPPSAREIRTYNLQNHFEANLLAQCIIKRVGPDFSGGAYGHSLCWRVALTQAEYHEVSRDFFSHRENFANHMKDQALRFFAEHKLI